MPFKKIGKKWFPLKKNGKPWKSGFPTEAKAKAAVAANKKRLSKLGGKRESPKKKTTKKKSNPKKKKNNPKKNKTGGKKMPKGPDLSSPSDIARLYAIAGAGLSHATAVARGGDSDTHAKRAIEAYTGFDLKTNKVALGSLWRGYGGIANDTAWRKFAKAFGFKAYPTKNPKSMSEFLDYITMYGAPVTHAIANKDDPHEANIRIYESLYGVDLNQVGFASWQPAEMAQTKLPYMLKKMIFKLARDAGVKIF